MRFSAVYKVSLFPIGMLSTGLPNSNGPQYAALRHEFMGEFAEYHRTHHSLDAVADTTCADLWREQFSNRKYLYRLEAHLQTIQSYIPSEELDLFDHPLDLTTDVTIEELIASPSWQFLTDLSREIENMRPDQIEHTPAHRMLLEAHNVKHLRQALSIVRLAQDPNPEHVPLFSAHIATGTPRSLSFEGLSQLIGGLRQLHVVLSGDEVSLEDKRSFMIDLTDGVDAMINMIRENDIEYHRPGDGLPRRHSEDPLARIVEITEQVVAHIDFCRGLLFRFVSRETRDHWMAMSRELHDLLFGLLEDLYAEEDFLEGLDEEVLVGVSEAAEELMQIAESLMQGQQDLSGRDAQVLLRRASAIYTALTDEGRSFLELLAPGTYTALMSNLHPDGEAREILQPRSEFEQRVSQLVVPPTDFVELDVPRERLLEHAVEWFEAHTGDEIRNYGFSINFLDEAGNDGGGLRREWFFLLAQAIADGTNGILVETESRRHVPCVLGDNVMGFVGKFVAKAIISGQRIPIRFAPHVLRFIIDGLDSVLLDLEMYREVNPSQSSSLSWILQNDPHSDGWEEATRDLSFSADLFELGQHSVHELIAGGADVPVTDENKVDYIQRLVEFKMRESVRPQLESFLAGFYSVLPRDSLEGGFTAGELDVVIAGQPEIDVADLRASTVYLGYARSDQQIVWFWEVVEGFNQEELSLLVKFTSGTPLTPVRGFANLPLKIARVGLHRNHANNPLPSSHTCENQLHLPAYTSKGELRDKLVRSITIGHEGFGFS
jgi:hypothetical protein